MSTNSKIEIFSWSYECEETKRSSKPALSTIVIYGCRKNLITDTDTKVQVAKINWNWNGQGSRSQVVHVRDQSLWDNIPEDQKEFFIEEMVNFWKERPRFVQKK